MRRRDVQQLLKPELGPRGWVSRGSVFELPLDASGSGILHWSGAQRSDGYWVLPRIGYHHIGLQQLAAQLRGEAYTRERASYAITLRDLMPERSPQEWQFGVGGDAAAARSIADAVGEYGMPFVMEIHRRGLPRLRELIEADPIASEWRYPAVLIAMGHFSTAEAMVRRQLQEQEDKNNVFAHAYRPFAERVFEHIRHGSEDAP